MTAHHNDADARHLKARVTHPSSSWRTKDIEIVAYRHRKKPRIRINFGRDVTVELRPNQAVALINTIADGLEHSQA